MAKAVRKIIRIDEKNVTVAGFVQQPAMKAQSKWLTGRQSLCANIFAMVLETAFRAADGSYFF